MLIPASIDDIELSLAVEQRFIDVCGTYQRLKHVQLTIPKDLQADLTLWRRSVVRFRSGDMRVSPDERKSLRRIAQWTLDVNCEIRNQPKQKLVWKD
jgi:hypothetical protein